MTHEVDFYGVLLPPLLVWAVVALAFRAVLRRALLRVGFYRFVAHPALFDIAMLVILTGGVAALSTRFFPI
jgi:hypothetical protein